MSKIESMLLYKSDRRRSEWMMSIDFNDPKHLRVDGVSLIPTIIVNAHGGGILGLAYSSEESLKLAIEKQAGVYHSRKRGLWVKSGTSRKEYQKLLKIDIDCDNDTLVFTVIPRGPHCHLGRMSCFTRLSTFGDQKEKLRIGYCIGNSREKSLQLLNSIGVDIYHSAVPRSTDYRVYSHLHPNIEILTVKPKDISLVIDCDIIVCYDNLFSKDDIERIKDGYICLETQPIHPTKLVALTRKEVLPPNPRVVTEYLEKSKDWCAAFGYDPISISGSAETYVKNHTADIGICITVSGTTIKANDLQIIDTLDTSDLRLYIGNNLYNESPRLIREIRNGLSRDVVYFYSVDGIEGFLSNFYTVDFTDSNGRSWKSSEHYYQAHKFDDQELFDLVASQTTCRDCYRTAWEHKDKWVDFWEKPYETTAVLSVPLAVSAAASVPFPLLYKDAIMYSALQYKFEVPELRAKLLETGQATLVEHAMRDYHFGIGSDGSGKNMLGLLLMNIRDSLK